MIYELKARVAVAKLPNSNSIHLKTTCLPVTEKVDELLMAFMVLYIRAELS